MYVCKIKKKKKKKKKITTKGAITCVDRKVTVAHFRTARTLKTLFVQFGFSY